MNDSKSEETVDSKKAEPFVEEEPVVVDRSIQLGDMDLHYRVTTGRMPLKNELGEIESQMFYVAYTKSDQPSGSRRPLIFTFNGGPGSPSIWLHLGAVGPMRAKMLDDGMLPPPPYELEENQQTWLADADLVFIDPIGTGFSRAHTQELGQKYWGVEGDIESVGEFIRLFLTRYDRWMSPLYLAGESYGTTRAAGLSGYLAKRGISFNGIILVSAILNFQTARDFKGNDLPFMVFLPSYTATAWYHGMLDKELSSDLQSTLSEVKKWALSDYALILAKGDSLSASERAEAVTKLARYTGLSSDYVDSRDLRIEIHAFCKELLRGKKRTVGRLDSRFKGIDGNNAAERPEHDPSMSALMGPYTAAFQHYVRTTLGYKTDLEYMIFNGVKSPWNWGKPSDGPPDTSEALRKAMAMNPYMKVFIASGYYDLATPFFATEYTFNHMGIDSEVRSNVVTKEYEAGHMMYINVPCLKQLKKDISSFVLESKRVSE